MIIKNPQSPSLYSWYNVGMCGQLGEELKWENAHSLDTHGIQLVNQCRSFNGFSQRRLSWNPLFVHETSSSNLRWLGWGRENLQQCPIEWGQKPAMVNFHAQNQFMIFWKHACLSSYFFGGNTFMHLNNTWPTKPFFISNNYDLCLLVFDTLSNYRPSKVQHA